MILKSWINSQRVTLSVTLGAIISIFLAFKSSHEPTLNAISKNAFVTDTLSQFPTGNSIIFNLSIGYIVSVIFWLMVVVLPRQHKRKLLRKNLLRHYIDFRQDMAHTMLDAAGDDDSYDKSFELVDYIKFREYFSGANRPRWSAALGEMQNDSRYITDLLVEMDILSNEFNYVLNNTEISDQELFEFCKRLLNYVYRLKNLSSYTDDHVKYLGKFIFETMGCWNTVEGERDSDIIEDMINRI